MNQVTARLPDDQYTYEFRTNEPLEFELNDAPNGVMVQKKHGPPVSERKHHIVVTIKKDGAASSSNTTHIKYRCLPEAIPGPEARPSSIPLGWITSAPRRQVTDSVPDTQYTYEIRSNEPLKFVLKDEQYMVEIKEDTPPESRNADRHYIVVIKKKDDPPKQRDDPPDDSRDNTLFPPGTSFFGRLFGPVISPSAPQNSNYWDTVSDNNYFDYD